FQAFDTAVAPHSQYERDVSQERNGLQVVGIVGQIFFDELVGDHSTRIRKGNGISVRRLPQQVRKRQAAPCSRFVFNDQRLSEALRQFFRNDASDDVGCLPRWKSHNYSDCFFWI